MTHVPVAAPLRVVLWGTGDSGKPRVRILRDGLRACGVELVDCRFDVWAGVRDKSQVGAWQWIRILLRIAVAYPVLLWRYARMPRHDWVLLAYPAFPDIFVARLAATLRGARIAMDWFLSAYDTVVCDRAMVAPRHPVAWALRGLEWLGVRLADRVFMDTAAHAGRMEQLFSLPAGSCGSVWVGVEAGAFPRRSGHARREPGRPLRVLFYGQFIPLHGIGTIIEAARLLRDEPVEWHLVGTGQEASRVRAMLAAAPLPRLRWTEWVEYGQLADLVAEADVCLGIFGNSAKAASVVPNKVFQAVAVGTPVITRDSPAIREFLDPACIEASVVPPGDPPALATALLRRLQSPDTFAPASRAPFDAPAIGRQLLQLLARDGHLHGAPPR